MLVIEKMIKDLQNDIKTMTPEEIIEKHGFIYTCRFCSIRGQQPPFCQHFYVSSECDMKCMEHIKEKLFVEYEAPYDLTFAEMRKMSEENPELCFERKGALEKYKVSEKRLKWAPINGDCFNKCVFCIEYLDEKYRVYEPTKEQEDE